MFFSFVIIISYTVIGLEEIKQFETLTCYLIFVSFPIFFLMNREKWFIFSTDK